MPPEDLTLMAVHAHPDDESIGTGGTLALYSAKGVRTVLVTCTNGELGDGPGGVKPGEPGHEEGEVVPMRLRELESSCEILGVRHLELLGYRDSGMMGWPQNSDPGTFWNTPVAEAAAPLAELMRRYRPQVVITYDSNGFYGHPDHIQAHRITLAAVEATGIPSKLYNPAVPRSAFAQLGERLRELGVDPPAGGQDISTPDEQISAYIDCSSVAELKFRSLQAHASQSENIFFLKMGAEVFAQALSREAYVRALDATGAPTPESDLFAGIA
jgi:LmbE family N-acetylglucosaminyl deacetylase